MSAIDQARMAPSTSPTSRPIPASSLEASDESFCEACCASLREAEALEEDESEEEPEAMLLAVELRTDNTCDMLEMAEADALAEAEADEAVVEPAAAPARPPAPQPTVWLEEAQKVEGRAGWHSPVRLDALGWRDGLARGALDREAGAPRRGRLRQR
jgi:hypothetical protein